jgi:ribonuclease Z
VVDKAIASLSAIEKKSTEVRMMLAEARDVQDYHATPVEAAQTAARAGVNTLIFTHIIPPLGNRLARFLVTERLFLRGVKEAFSGQVLIADDGTRIDLIEKR